MLLLPLHSGSYKVLEALCKEPRRKIKHIFPSHDNFTEGWLTACIHPKSPGGAIFKTSIFRGALGREEKCLPINIYHRGWFQRPSWICTLSCILRPAPESKGSFAGHLLWEGSGQEEGECSGGPRAGQPEPTGSEGPHFHWVVGKAELMVGRRPNQRTGQHFGLLGSGGRA